MIDIGLAGALVGGVLSLLSPCSVMLLPAFFAYAFGSVRQILARTAIFYLGLVTTLVPLGVFASALGGLITTNRQTLISVVATLIIIAGLPGAFVRMFFAGSLLIETIFSLNGLGLLGFEAAMQRDYPVMFATLYIFTLIGLVTSIIGDLTMTKVDPRIDFSGRSKA